MKLVLILALISGFCIVGCNTKEDKDLSKGNKGVYKKGIDHRSDIGETK